MTHLQWSQQLLDILISLPLGVLSVATLQYSVYSTNAAFIKINSQLEGMEWFQLIDFKYEKNFADN